MCDRRILSSDPHDWDELLAESAASERYSRRLGERISDGYRAKFEVHGDQAGLPPLGFRRRPEPPHTLEVDAEAIRQAVHLFERYALGTVSIKQLAAETGLEEMRIQQILRNPIYNGWMRRHRGRDEERRPAPWRPSPPVDDELWATVERVRRHEDPRRRPSALGSRPTSSLAYSSASAAGTSAATGRSPTAAIASSIPTPARSGVHRPATATRCGRNRSWRSWSRCGSTTPASPRSWPRSASAERPVTARQGPARAADARARDRPRRRQGQR